MRFRSFFYAIKKYFEGLSEQINIESKRVEVELCVQKSHWHVQNAKIVITIRQRIRKHILTEWKQRNIVDSAKLTHYTKKPNNLFGSKEEVK